MSASRSLAWVGIVVIVGVALGAALASRAGLVRVPDPRRYVRDAAGRLVEIRHATARPVTGGSSGRAPRDVLAFHGARSVRKTISTRFKALTDEELTATTTTTSTAQPDLLTTAKSALEVAASELRRAVEGEPRIEPAR